MGEQLFPSKSVKIIAHLQNLMPGGLLSNTLGWRWAFIIQIPFLLFSAVIIWMKVHIPLPPSPLTTLQKLAKIDFLGCFTLVITVSSLLIAMTLKTSSDTELAWSDGRVWGLLVVSLVGGVAFIVVEKYVAKAPLMPLRLVT